MSILKTDRVKQLNFLLSLNINRLNSETSRREVRLSLLATEESMVSATGLFFYRIFAIVYIRMFAVRLNKRVTMKYIFFAMFFALLVSGCSMNKYYLDDTKPDKTFLVEKINEFQKEGLISKKPILVIDGIEYVSLKDINLTKMKLSKDDIKSVELLKKPAALRIFGNIGERGVLLITTKTTDKK